MSQDIAKNADQRDSTNKIEEGQIDIQITISTSNKSDQLELLGKAFAGILKEMGRPKSKLVERVGGVATEGEKGPRILSWNIRR